MWKFKHATSKLRQNWREAMFFIQESKGLGIITKCQSTLESSMSLMYVFLHFALLKAHKIFNMLVPMYFTSSEYRMYTDYV